MFSRLLLMMTAVLTALTTVRAATRPTFSIVDITPQGVFGAIARAINEPGQIVGEVFVTPSEGKALLWSKDGRAAYLPIAWPIDINNRGQVIGQDEATSVESDMNRAVLWDRGQVINLGTLPGMGFSFATAINNRGDVVGTVYALDGEHLQAFRWSGAAMEALDPLPGDIDSWASDINDRGQIVGWSRDANYTVHAVMWYGDEIFDLGDPAGTGASRATAINNRSEVIIASRNAVGAEDYFLVSGRESVGLAYLPLALNERNQMLLELFDFPNATVWDLGGDVTRLPTLSDAVASHANDLNDKGEIVGWVTLPNVQSEYGDTPVSRAVVWQRR